MKVKYNQPPCNVEMNDSLSLFSNIVYSLSASYQSTSLIRTRIPFRLYFKYERGTFFL